MKEIIINENNSTTSDIVGELCKIDLTTDVVISCPYWDKNYDDISYDIDQFILFNRHDIKSNTNDNYTFYPRIKYTLPEGLISQFSCRIPGISIIQRTFTKYKGIQLVDNKMITDDLIIDMTAIEGSYNIYYKTEFILTEFDRNLFLKNKNLKNRVNIKIFEHTDVLDMYLVESFIGRKTRSLGEIYLIRSNYIYDNFPNFGDCK